MRLFGSGHAKKNSGRKGADTLALAKKQGVAAITGFVLMSCLVIGMSVASEAAQPRGDLPPVFNVDAQNFEFTETLVPMAATPVFEEEFDAEPEVDPQLELRFRALGILESMTETERIYQMFFVTPEVLTGFERVYRAGKTTETALAAQPVGGLLYSSWNIETDEIAAEMLVNTQGFSATPLLLVADESIPNWQALGFNATTEDLAGVSFYVNPQDLAASVAAIESDLENFLIAQSDIDEAALMVIVAKLEMGIIE